MSSSAIGNLSGSYLHQVPASSLQTAGITANSTSNASTTIAASSSKSDSSRLSPFAQLAGTLQQLQESDPTKYKQVTQQVATNLQSAAQTAQSQGNSGAAGQLTQLASDFTSASQTGQLPNLQDLAQAIGGAADGSGGHYHHHAGAASGDSQSAQGASTNPEAIILRTLASAGINLSNS